MEKLHSRVLPYCEATMKEAAERIKLGKVVSFPTETVYGLGANALDKDATTLIFTTKERPMNDPLIVHVTSFDEAKDLIDIDDNCLKVYELLAKKYWPGPLTIVVKANDKKIPPTVTAGTGCVGIRCPNHKIALELIKLSGFPIAAPSANKFGHVSPTNPQHVEQDFINNDVLIIDGGSCSFGIESTVAKIVAEKEKSYLIHILRKGGISEESLQKTILESELSKVFSLRVEAKAHVAPAGPKEEAKTLFEAPGMLLKHYSPRLDTYIFDDFETLPSSLLPLSECALIDFAQLHCTYSLKVGWYHDLSIKGDVEEAIGKIYEFLRLAESQPSIKRIFLANMKSGKVESKISSHKEHTEALYDRMFRASAGKIYSS